MYVVGTSGYQNWMHVYTAITRGQKRVYVVSTDAELKGALSRKENPRLTRLAGLVKEQVVQLVQASPNLQRNHNGSPKFTSQKSTPQRSSPQVPPWQTPGSKAIVPKRLLGAGGPVGTPYSWPMKENVKQGTARLGAAAAETEAGSPPRKKTKKTKVSGVPLRCEVYLRIKRSLQMMVAVLPGVTRLDLYKASSLSLYCNRCISGRGDGFLPS